MDKMSLMAKDKWNSKAQEYDKLYHFFGCWAMFFFLLGFTSSTLSVFLTILFGLLWEVKDIFRADGFSWKDLVADILGVVAGYIWYISRF
jgi:VanZ family protein